MKFFVITTYLGGTIPLFFSNKWAIAVQHKCVKNLKPTVIRVGSQLKELIKRVTQSKNYP
jgi:hypothetical protein